MQTIRRRDICAVVVTYFPDSSSFADNMRALAPQVDRIVIVDNGSTGCSLRGVESAAQEIDGMVVPMGGNAGIAAALNVGLDYAARNGYGWLATFDQDSRPTPSMIGEMARTLSGYARAERVAVLAPRHVDRDSGLLLRQRGSADTAENWRTLLTTMTSGNLVAVKAALPAGGWDERLFIDYVDHEFCLRLRQLGWEILEAANANLQHSLGRIEVHRFLGRRLAVTNHSSARRYYISRNRMILWRRYWRREACWCRQDFRSFLHESAGIVLFEREARRKIWMTLRGIVDSFRSVAGPLESSKRIGP
jgi:rhamnosyltransferase